MSTKSASNLMAPYHAGLSESRASHCSRPLTFVDRDFDDGPRRDKTVIDGYENKATTEQSMREELANVLSQFSAKTETEIF